MTNESKEKQEKETISFGKMINEDGNDISLNWIVLKKEKDRWLVLSEKPIIELEYMRVAGANWKKSTVRKWLRNEFYKNAFDYKEKRRIIEVVLESPRDNIFGDGVIETKDKVFLLSAKEIKKYLKTMDERHVPGYTTYFLRDGGRIYGGSIITSRRGCDGRVLTFEEDYVRPAMWIKI